MNKFNNLFVDLLDKIHENIMDICMSVDKEILSE